MFRFFAILLLIQAARSNPVASVQQNASETASSRMSNVLQWPMHMNRFNTHMPYSTRVHQFGQNQNPSGIDPFSGSIGGSGGGHRLVGDMPPYRNPSTFHNMDRLTPHLSSPIVPLAVSFSVALLLFRLLAVGVFLLEKEFSFPYGGQWKMDDMKLEPAILGKPLYGNTDALSQLIGRFQRALDKHGHMNKHAAA